jgi:F-type H+-transporting ATPase subunit delta
VRETTVARNYAEALFELGEKQKLHDSFAASLEALDAVLQSSPQLRLFLGSPKIEPKTKKAALRKALEGRADALFLNFLMILIDKRRQRLLEAIGEEYRHVVDERLGRLHVQVTLAHEPDQRGREELTERLSRSLGRQVVPHLNVNREILGGIIVRFGDRVLDGSLRRRLLSLRRRLLDAGLPAH